MLNITAQRPNELYKVQWHNIFASSVLTMFFFFLHKKNWSKSMFMISMSGMQCYQEKGPGGVYSSFKLNFFPAPPPLNFLTQILVSYRRKNYLGEGNSHASRISLPLPSGGGVMEEYTPLKRTFTGWIVWYIGFN